MDINLIKQTLSCRDRELKRQQAENDFIDRRLAAIDQEVAAISRNLQRGQQAVLLVEEVAGQRRNTVKGGIEGVVTDAVRLVYGPGYAVELGYDTKAGRSNLSIEMVRQTNLGEVRRSMEGFGGGMSDCISVPLRLMVMLNSRQTDKVLVLDECYKHMDLSRVEYVAEFLRDIAQKLGIQIILCSHHDAMRSRADVIYKVVDAGGKAEVERTERMAKP